MAVAALVSLTDVLDNVQHPASCHRLHLDIDRIQSLQDKVQFLQDLLEVHSQRKSQELEDLARQITVVANDVEDIIDLHVVDQLHIEDLIVKIDSITKELMMTKEDWGNDVQDQKPIPSQLASSSTGLPSSSKNSTMVGFDGRLLQIIDELTKGESNLFILPIIGMGGIGKTTLAQNAFDHPYIVNHFDVRIWFTISQEYSVKKILLDFLNDGKTQESNETLAKLGERFHKKLFGRRYLIVMDDVWNIKAWNELSLFFPDNENRSRIMMTTRMSEVAVSLGCHNPYLMSFLNEEESWSLLCEKVFGQKGYTYPILEKIGKEIAKACRGLPLAIVAIAGLLANSNMQQEYWESIAKNVNSFANSQDNEHCLKIKVSELVQVWIGEGFIKSIRGKILEETANGYLEDLVDRNLILIHQRTVCEKIKRCSIHDLSRDLCLREFDKEHFVRNLKVRWDNRSEWRLFSSDSWKYFWGELCFLCCKSQLTVVNIDIPIVYVGTRSASVANISICDACKSEHPNFAKLRLARVMDDYAGDEMLESTKLRCLFLQHFSHYTFHSSSLHLLWNLKSLFVDLPDNPNNPSVLPNEIWEMPRLRHLKFRNALLPDPITTQGSTILVNLHTLSGILNFKCTKEVVERIPNLKKLKVKYFSIDSDKCSGGYCLENLAYLPKLESLSLSIPTFSWYNLPWYEMFGLGAGGHMHIAFPNSLKKLTLEGGRIPWENTTVIGSLPNLEVLKLLFHAFDGLEWNPEEGQFSGLKALHICESNLEWWRAESAHFPSLERLFLTDMAHLKEIPSEIGDIATLRSIHLDRCSKSATISAKQIKAEQDSKCAEHCKCANLCVYHS
ncbi:putative late blight resistance proteinR1A-10 [Sesamum alatum]|uniref:Late blight resistance proteinR1A-10 n=1 Tax=Sesamum alatum TaxID=300844 RepID=A0AAE1YWE9_9LAMI|nr:putative late blight resistance proteinR1A-10 [Sesamum alatum]